MKTVKNIKIRIIFVSIISLLLTAADPVSIDDYIIKSFVFDSTGTYSLTAEYKNIGSAGQVFTRKNTNTSYINYEGYLSPEVMQVSTPSANAGSDMIYEIPCTIILDGSKSGDPDGNIVSYKWEQVSGIQVSLNDSGSSMAVFVPDEIGTYVFRLEVTDEEGLTDTDIINITVKYKFLLGDFDEDKDMDFDDLSLFAVYWKNDDVTADIGPAVQGETAPYYTDEISKDNLVEFEDLMIFTLNWNYINVQPSYISSRRAKSFTIVKSYSNSISVEFKKTERKGWYRVESKGSGDFLGCHLEFDSVNCEIINADLNWNLVKQKFVILKRADNSKLELNIVNLDKNRNYFISEGTVIADLEIEGEGSIDFRYSVKDNQNRTVSNSFKQYSTMQEQSGGESAVSLGQNYPNPFNPETWIPFAISESCDVKIVIYNLVGQKIRTISKGYCEKGEYKTKDRAVYWDGFNDYGDEAASGVYFYKLIAGNYTSVKRMVVLK